jgi:drug/metabolite transporter (DMT)-like permease
VIERPHGRSSIAVHGALLLVAILFGTNYVVAKVAMRQVSPPALLAIRVSGATAILAGLCGVRRLDAGTRPMRLGFADVAQIFLFSVLGVSLNQILFLEGLERSTATNASLILVTIPILTLGFALLLGKERASFAGVIGIGLGLAGALLLILPRGVDLSGRSSLGNVLLLLNGASYALYLVLTKSILVRFDPLTVVTWVFALATLTVVPLGLRDLRVFLDQKPSPATWGCIAYVIVGGTALPYLLNNWALVRARSSFVAVYIFFQPLIAGTLGRIFLLEDVGAHTVVAALLIGSGVFLSSRGREQRAVSAYSRAR